MWFDTGLKNPALDLLHRMVQNCISLTNTLNVSAAAVSHTHMGITHLGSCEKHTHGKQNYRINKKNLCRKG